MLCQQLCLLMSFLGNFRVGNAIPLIAAVGKRRVVGRLGMTNQIKFHGLLINPLVTLNSSAGLGYNGRGVATATMTGRQLALAVLGESPDLEIQPLRTTYSFHPFRRVGISYRLLAGTLLDRRPRMAER